MGKYCLIILTISMSILAAVTGCAPTQPNVSGSAVPPSVSRKPVNAAPDTVIFDPMKLGDDGILVPRPKEVIASEESTPAVVPAQQETLAEPKVVVEEWEDIVRPGYRVQIFAATGVDAARMVEKEAMQLFPEGVYLSYDPPNYKIRVGNCPSRKEADVLLQKAKSLRYRDAWVVRDNVVVKIRVK